MVHEDSKHLSLANLVWKNEAFQKECEFAKKELYGGCIEAIKQKEYTKAEAYNAASEAIQALLDRFKLMADRYAQLTTEEPDNEEEL